MIVLLITLWLLAAAAVDDGLAARAMTTDTPTIGEQRDTICHECGRLTTCTYGPDPFAEEIRGDDTPMWLCAQCHQASIWET